MPISVTVNRVPVPTITSALIANGTIVDADINANAAIGLSKLETGSLPTAITVTSANLVDGTIVDADINANAAIVGSKIDPNFGSQNIIGFVRPTAGTTSAAPLLLSSGTNLTTAAAGAIEYDGTHFYGTPTSAARGHLPAFHTFRLESNGSAITTIADFYGASSAINLVATAVYDLEFFAYFLKTTAGTVTWTLTASSAPTVISAAYTGSPVTGMVSGTPVSGAPITGYAGSMGSTTAAFAATASITDARFMALSFRVQLITNAATTFKLQATCGAGSLTPQARSFYTVRRVAANTGSFA
jgi:hypothetical protein